MIKHNTTYLSVWAWAWVIGIVAFAIVAFVGASGGAEETNVVTVAEGIAYGTTYIDDAELELGKTAVREPGSPGVRENTYKVTSSKGKEVSRELVDSVVTKEPKDEVLAKGSKLVWHCHDATSYDKNPYNDNYCEYSDGTIIYVPDSEARSLDASYSPGQYGAPYYNKF